MTRRNYVCVCTALAALLCGAVCAEAQETSATKNSDAEVVGRIGKTAITMQDVDAKALGTNMKLAQSLYDARLAAIDEIIMERALSEEAAARGVSIDELIRQKVAEKSIVVTDEAVQAYYNANSARMKGRTLEQVSGQIRNFLASESQKTAQQELLAEIKKSVNVQIMLEPPRVTVAIAGNDPFMGAPDAKVTIVEYGDFQ